MIAKQDRSPVRTPANIEQKYKLDQNFDEIIKIANNAQRAATNAQSTANNAATEAAEAKSIAGGMETELSAIMSRLEALESAVIATVAVSDSQGDVDTLLNISGLLTVSGHNVGQSSEPVIVPGGNAVVSYTLSADISVPRSFAVNGTSFGVVSAAGDTVSANIPVVSGSEITIVFTGE